MHCASCAKTIESAVSRLIGVKSAQVNFGAETLLAEFDEAKISVSELVKAVEGVGYKILGGTSAGKEVDGGKNFLSFKVVGMDSPHCAMIVEKALKTLPGVEKADLDFNNARAKIVFDPKRTSEKEIEKVIDDTGYEAIPETSEVQDILEKEKQEREKESADLKRKVIIGAVFSIAIFLGSFPEWFPFVPKILTNYLALFLLTTPVQFWVGSRFYRGLVILFKYRTADMNTLIAIGTLAAYFYSSAVTFFPDFFERGGIPPKVYFDTSAI